MRSQTGIISTKARNGLRTELAGNVARSKKALATAKTLLDKVTAKATAAVTQAKAAFESANTVHTEAQDAHSKFEQAFGSDGSKSTTKTTTASAAAPKVRQKPGPKPGAKKAKAAAKAVKKAAVKAAAPKARQKPGPKPGAKKAKAAAAKAPRKRGEGMTMVEAMAHVMGTKTMAAGEVVDALEAKGLMPKSNKPRAYASAVLSSAVENLVDAEGKQVLEDGKPVKVKVFGKASHGHYYVAKKKGEVIRVGGGGGGNGGPKKAEPKKRGGRKAAPAAAAAAEAPAPTETPAAPAEAKSTEQAAGTDAADSFLREHGIDPAKIGTQPAPAPLS